MFQVIISQRARKLPEHYKRRVIELLLIFRENPVPAEYYDIKKLKGYTDTYRARIGEVRVIYEILWDLKKVMCYLSSVEKEPTLIVNSNRFHILSHLKSSTLY